MDTFKKILQIPTSVLPLGIFLILSSNLSDISGDVLFSMKGFCISTVISFAVIVLIAFLIIVIYSPISFVESIKALKSPIIVAFSTCSNQATLPFLTSVLVDKFKLPETAVNLSIPLGVTMCRTANVAYYSFMTIFITSLYNEPLAFIQYGFIIFGSILASLAASGASGIVAVTMISIILDPLNLSIGSLAILIVIDPLIEPLRATTSLIMNAAISCTIVKRRSKVLTT